MDHNDHGNSGPASNDGRSEAVLQCAAARVLASARADGELATEAERTRLDLHLQGCQTCRSWNDSIYDLRRSITLRSPLPPVDLADRVLGASAPVVTGAGQGARYVLGVVAASIAVLNLPLFLGTSGQTHDSRHLGAFGLALGVGLFWAALRPERASGLVPLGVALVAVTIVGVGVDMALGRTGVASEALHLLELAGLGLLWWVAGRPGPFGPSTPAPRPTGPAEFGFG